jgi:GWxTD domain-containing protein
MHRRHRASNRTCSIVALAILAAAIAAAQPSGDELRMATMYVRGSAPDSSRLDVYTALPYRSIQFASSGRDYVGSYRLAITIRDNTGMTVVHEQSLERTLRAGERPTASSEMEDITQSVFTVPPGRYRVEVSATDQLSSRQWRTAQHVTIPDWRRQPIGISGILLVSRIEERNRRYVLTPYIGSDIGALGDGFFAFFEVYSGPERALQLRARILDSTTTVYATAWQSIRTDSTGTAQHFIRIVPPVARMPQGQYMIRVEAATDTTTILASAERSIELRYGVSSSIFSDITRTIRQLRYIATQAEIDSMLAKPTDAERRAAFEQFWKEHDPTPGTLRNEAFEEYYARIEYANRNFRSYTEGWLTDMGMVYIVLGEPSSVERRVNPYDNRSIIIWTYTQLNRRYIFIDNTGFGDYRLSPSTPFFLSEKYRYRGVQ